MKVYAVFKQMMLMPYLTEVLVNLYQSKDDADDSAHLLNEDNTDPMEEDGYGPLSGSRYFVAEIEVK